MRKQIILISVTAIFAFSFSSCKKSSDPGNPVITTIKADTVFTVAAANAFPAYNSWDSFTMDPDANKIFFYYPDAVEGFKIDLYDVSTGSTSTIYKHFSQSGLTSWSTSNGSEGMRLRYFKNTFDGNKLIVPGGATNPFIIEILVHSDYSASFQRLDSIPASNNGISVSNAYDADLVKASANNLISVVSMNNSVFDFYASVPVYRVSATSHGSSIVGTPGGLEYVFCGSDKTLELYNSGVFVRSISMPYSEAQLQMDSKKRIYAYNGSSIFRFTPDLLTKEEFPVKGSVSGYRQCCLVIKEYSNYVQAYSFDRKDLIGLKLPL